MEHLSLGGGKCRRRVLTLYLFLFFFIFFFICCVTLRYRNVIGNVTCQKLSVCLEFRLPKSVLLTDFLHALDVLVFLPPGYGKEAIIRFSKWTLTNELVGKDVYGDKSFKEYIKSCYNK